MIWKINAEQVNDFQEYSIEELKVEKFANEPELEEIIEKNISIASKNLLVVSRQCIIPKSSQNFTIDMLALNRDGDLIIIEFKKDQAHRKTVAQAIEYASLVEELDYEAINRIFKEYAARTNNADKDLELIDYIKERFKEELKKESINQQHRMIIIASQLDNSIKRIIEYLRNNSRKVNINGITINMYRDKDGAKYITSNYLFEESWLTENKAYLNY